MQIKLRELHDQLMELTHIAALTGHVQLRKTLWEAALHLRRARNIVDKIVDTSEALNVTGR